MNIWLIVSIVLALICICCIVKIFLINKSIKNIAKDLEEILNKDTNNLITISTSNKQIKRVANSLNTELKKLRKEIVQYENGSKDLKKNITNISHDMRTPLTAISGYVELLEKESMDQNKFEERKHYIEVIKRKTNELTELTEQLFNFSITLDTYDKAEKENCCINEILEETLAEFYDIFKERKMLPIIKLCKDKTYKNLDKRALKRTFENILSNIIKYSDGEFTVELERSGKIIFSNKAKELDTTSVQKIFDRYYTVENAKKSTGIGLSIAKQLAELNSGNIEAKYIDGNLIIEVTF